MNQGDPKKFKSDAAPRRAFLVRLAALVTGGIVTLFPFAAGLGVLFDPLRRRRAGEKAGEAEAANFLRICPLDALPADNIPRQFAVIADAADAWTRATGQRIGSLFLNRRDSNGEPQVVAFSATCPHLGCAVEFDVADGRFECPCHESAFGMNGAKLFGPSLRGLDPLDVKIIEKDGRREVWVAYEKYMAGIAERIPVG